MHKYRIPIIQIPGFIKSECVKHYYTTITVLIILKFVSFSFKIQTFFRFNLIFILNKLLHLHVQLKRPNARIYLIRSIIIYYVNIET